MSKNAAIEQRHRDEASPLLRFAHGSTGEHRIAQALANAEHEGERRGFARGVNERGEKTYDEGVRDGLLAAKCARLGFMGPKEIRAFAAREKERTP